MAVAGRPAAQGAAPRGAGRLHPGPDRSRRRLPRARVHPRRRRPDPRAGGRAGLGPLGEGGGDPRPSAIRRGRDRRGPGGRRRRCRPPSARLRRPCARRERGDRSALDGGVGARRGDRPGDLDGGCRGGLHRVPRHRTARSHSRGSRSASRRGSPSRCSWRSSRSSSIPLFASTRPLRNPALETLLRSVERQVGASPGSVSVSDASSRTTEENAFVDGVGPTERMVLYDTVLRRAPDDQTRALLAHELGHVKRRHTLKGVLWFGVLGPARAVGGAVGRRARGPAPRPRRCPRPARRAAGRGRAAGGRCPPHSGRERHLAPVRGRGGLGLAARHRRRRRDGRRSRSGSRSPISPTPTRRAGRWPCSSTTRPWSTGSRLRGPTRRRDRRRTRGGS